MIENEQDDRQLDLLIQTVPNFERIGDYATNFVEFAQKLKSEDATFSESAKEELQILGEAVNEIIGLTIDAFTSEDADAAKKIEPLEEVIDDMVMILRDRHTLRLKNGTCTIGSGLVFMETLTYMERASDQCSSIAVLMMMARNNKDVVENHYDYLRNLHAGNDAVYNSEMALRREQYIVPLNNIGR